MAPGCPEDLPELHRPYIDQVVLRCPHCGKPMHRVKEVIDCWYDSGSMPFAQWHYPFENKETFEQQLPGQLHLRGRGPDPGMVLYPAGHLAPPLFDQLHLQKLLGHGPCAG